MRMPLAKVRPADPPTRLHTVQQIERMGRMLFRRRTAPQPLKDEPHRAAYTTDSDRPAQLMQHAVQTVPPPGAPVDAVYARPIAVSAQSGQLSPAAILWRLPKPKATRMNFTQRRGAIAFAIILGSVLTGVIVTLNIGWIILNERRVALMVLGIICFAALIVGVVLNTIFLVREVRRNQRQDSFLNAVTHELKTPIASIRLYLETLQRRPVDEAQRQEFYSIMLSDSDRLLATVERVLTAGSLQQRRHDRSVLELEPLIERCIQTTLLQHKLPADAITLAPVPGAVQLHVFGNADDLRNAMMNVLENAVKYSPEGVHIRISLLIERYTFAVIRVSDTGLGFPPKQQKRIFKRFYRVPGRTASRIPGTGLGLFLVRSILRQHGGDARAESRGPGSGATIVLTLPLATPDAHAAPSSTQDLAARQESRSR